MKLFVADIPDNAAELPAWLESQLTGPNLGELVAELTAVHRPTASPTLDEILGDLKTDVLANGLGVLKPARIARLLTNPKLLLQLQELICVEGGAYWAEVTPYGAMDLDAQVSRGRERLEAYLEAQTAPVVPARLVRPMATPEPSRFPWVWSALAMAACVGVAVYLSRPPLPTWGWNGPTVLTAQSTGPEYLRRLADAAGEWQAQPHETKEQLKQRLDELKLGCNRLIAAEHKQLAAADKDWLLEKCRTWAVKIDELRADAAQTTDVPGLRTKADETIKQFTDALRARAKEAA